MQTVFRLVLGQDHSWSLAADLSLQLLSRWPTGHTCVLTADAHDLTYALFSQIGVRFANRLCVHPGDRPGAVGRILLWPVIFRNCFY